MRSPEKLKSVNFFFFHRETKISHISYGDGKKPCCQLHKRAYSYFENSRISLRNFQIFLMHWKMSKSIHKFLKSSFS